MTIGSIRILAAKRSQTNSHPRLGAAGLLVCPYRTRRRLPVRNCRPFWPLRGQECWLWKLRRLHAIHRQGEFLHASGHDSISCLGGNSRRIVFWDRIDSRDLASLDLPRKRLTARSVWDRHGHFVWDQVALGLSGLLCFRRGNLASASRLRAGQKAKRSITEYECDHHEAILAVIRHVGIAPWRIAIPAVLRFTEISDWTGG